MARRQPKTINPVVYFLDILALSPYPVTMRSQQWFIGSSPGIPVGHLRQQVLCEDDVQHVSKSIKEIRWVDTAGVVDTEMPHQIPC